jgi:hypothetical protein
MPAHLEQARRSPPPHPAPRLFVSATHQDIAGVTAMTAARAISLVTLLAASTLAPARALTPAIPPEAQIVQPVQPVQGAQEPRRPTVCTEQYAPVCGRLNDVLKTYPNACYARAAGAEVVAQGPCGDGRLPPSPR